MYPTLLFKAYDDEVQEKERIKYIENECPEAWFKKVFENHITPIDTLIKEVVDATETERTS